MTSPDAELRRLAEAATPGPWVHEEGRTTIRDLHPEHKWPWNTISTYVVLDKDAAFIAAANPATVLALLDRIEAVRALCSGHTGRTHDTYDEGWVDALNHVLDALDGTP